MSLVLKQIFLTNENLNNIHVNYENKLKPRMVFHNLSMEELFQKHYDGIIKKIDYEITEYLNDEFLCNDDIDMFPRRCEMTGEWYIADVYFNELSYLSIMVHFLGFHPNSKRMPIDDYLGLDLLFFYNKIEDEFIFDGINSSCI